MGKYGAFLTTIRTPHNGSVTVDKLLRFTNIPLEYTVHILVIPFKFIRIYSRRIIQPVVAQGRKHELQTFWFIAVYIPLI